MHRIPIRLLYSSVALLMAAPALAQQPPPRQPRTIDELFNPQPSVTVPPPGGVQSVPLPPPPGARPSPVQPAPPQPAQRGKAQDAAAPPAARKDQPARKGAPAQPQPSEVPPSEQKIANPTASFSGLDKITGRIFAFDAAINETVQFGALQVTPKICYTRPPTEPQNTTAFIEVEEITLEGKMRRLFSGWIFAASPGLNAVEHPIYDVWLVDCKLTPPEIKPAG